MINKTIEKIKEYLKSIIDHDIGLYNVYTFEYDRMYRKVATDILEKIEELEST